MSLTVTLSVGLRVLHDGEIWTVDGFNGPWVRLAKPGSSAIVVATTSLAGDPGFRLVDDHDPPVEASGPVLDKVQGDEYRALMTLEAEILEMRSGFRRGSKELALPGEPRAAYAPGTPTMVRYAAKAEELGVSVATVRRWSDGYEADGLAGLVDGRSHKAHAAFGRVDPRWIQMALVVISEHVGATNPPKQLVLDRTNARVRAAHGSEVKLPGRSTANRVLTELTNGKETFAGSSAKQKRSIAERPATPYSRIRASRVGEFVLLDTSPLDVFAMDPITLRWLGMQLTIAFDLGARSVTGLRLSPVSAKAVDAALVLYETISPNSRSHTSVGLLPYGGVPSTIYIPGDGGGSEAGLPGTALDTIVIDHGKMYLAAHVRCICQRLGVSIQPARKHTPTDKSPLERFFRSIREDLLAALPGYKGPDVYSRGKNIEDLAFYFTDELEALIRDWVVNRYHKRPHKGLCEPGVPGLDLCPDEMWELLQSRSGVLTVPRRPDLVYDFLPVEWRTIQHYGVEVNGLRFDGPGLEGYRGLSSPYIKAKGKWPLRNDPDDATRVYFQRPDDLSWHTLKWIHAREIPVPFSVDTLRYARKLAITEGRHPDDREALRSLLERWDAGLLANPTERRMAVRLSEQRAARLGSTDAQDTDPETTFAHLPSDPFDLPYSDDDDEDELDVDTYYDDAMEVGQ